MRCERFIFSIGVGPGDFGPSRPGGWGLTHERGSPRWGLNVRPQVPPPTPGLHAHPHVTNTHDRISFDCFALLHAL